MLEVIIFCYYEIMITEHVHKNISWVDVESPTQEDLAKIIKDYNLNPVCAQELMNPIEQSKVDVYDNALFLVLHYPDHPARAKHVEEIEIDFVIMKDRLITVHYKPIDTLIEFGERFKVDAMLNRTNADTLTGGNMFLHINNMLYRGLITELDAVHALIKRTELQVFQGNELSMVREISKLSRTILDFKQSLRYHASVLKSFHAQSKRFFGESFDVDLELVVGEHVKIESLLENERDLLRELHETNDSLLTAKNNDTIRRLTIISSVVLPITAIAGIFGMNTRLPLVNDPNGFYLILLVMLIFVGGMFAYFLKKHWI